MAAMDLFTTNGYEATTVAEILKRAGVNSGSLYDFFDNKHDLLVEGLEFFKTLLYPIVMQPAFAREEDPIERIFAVLEDYRGRLVTTGLDYECPVGKLALEVARHSPRINGPSANSTPSERARAARAFREARPPPFRA